ncbi:MAG: hypothetical protein LQ337_003815 [Flavoplaca oasis]|nr:MAG: hypothetical protein LQ337_003815 [Flavoplaca oasis]
MEEFAQTREPDNLFDDDFTPLAESEPVVEQLVQSSSLQPHSPVNNHSRGWGRGRPSHQQRTHCISQPAVPAQDVTASSTAEPAITEQSAAPKTPSAVRGDRSATGGNAKPKLTEEELSARLAAAKLNSQKREEAHRLAEADEASFQQREAQASQRRQEEGRARRVMDQEREKNRLRKLGAQGGREWDEGKEDQLVDPRRSEYRREPHGGPSNYQGSEAQGGNLQTDGNYNDANRGYGRGGRSRGDKSRGRGRGRGGRGRGVYDSSASGFEIIKPAAPNIEKDFPALPSAATRKSVTDTSHHQTKGEQQPQVEVPKFQAPLGGGESWADEVAGKGP